MPMRFHFQHLFMRGAVPLCLSVLAGCLFSAKDPDRPGGAGTVTARLLLQPAPLAKAAAKTAATPLIDSVAVRVTAADMPPREFSFAGESLAVTLPGLPPGAGRSVEAALFRRGRLLYLGRAVCDLKAEVPLDLALRCEPQYSRVLARFHLPAGLPAPVADGSLRLAGASGEWTAPLAIRDEFGTFLLDEIPGNARYDVTMTLSDTAGRPEYRSDRAGMYLPLGEEAHWDLPLAPLQAQAGVALTLADPGLAEVTPAFPARKRRPLRAGEAVVTEFYASPAARDSLSEGEWWEIFNRGADTLVLAGCRLSRDRLGGVTRSFAFDSSHVLPPGQARVFGRSAARADFHYQDFSLVNTAASLLLLCAGDSLVVDSLRYSSVAADSAIALPMRDGKVTGLGAEALSRRGLAGSWCLRAPESASPGTVAACGE
jgi:hypothetical protein